MGKDSIYCPTYRVLADLFLQRRSRCHTLSYYEPWRDERSERISELHSNGQVHTDNMSDQWPVERSPRSCSDVCERRDCAAHLEFEVFLE